MYRCLNSGVLLVALLVATACSPEPPAMTLHIFDCGTLVGDDIGSMSDTGEFDGLTWTFAVPCYLITHPDGTLFWDGGFSEAQIASTDNGAGGFLASLDQSLEAQLGEIGRAPSDVDFIALSHLHYDHTGNANAFAGSATWLVRAAQLD
jgi:N-acyl homoserine lactone hydrolase